MPAGNKSLGKSGADGKNLNSISLLNFSYGLTDPNPLAVLRKKTNRKLNFGGYGKFSFLQIATAPSGPNTIPQLPKAGGVVQHFFATSPSTLAFKPFI